MRKRRKYSSSALSIIFIIFTLLSLRLVFYLYSSYKNSLWRDHSNLNISYYSKDIMLVVFSSLSKKTYVIKIPEKAYVPSVERFFGIKVDGYYKNENLSFQNFDIKLSDVIFDKSDLTLFDYLKIKSGGYKTDKIDLEKQVKSHPLFIKNKEYEAYSGADLDAFFGDIFKDEILSRSASYFKINYSGLSSKDDLKFYERLIPNVGWKLSDEEQEDLTNKKNICFVKNKKTANSFFKKVFNCEIKEDSSVNYDVVLTLGNEKN